MAGLTTTGSLASPTRPRLLACSVLAALCAFAPATRGQSDEPQTPDAYVVECGVLLTGMGERIENGALVVRDGTIEAVLSAADPRPALRRIDATAKVVMPGLVAADTDLANVRDAEYQVTPDFLALDSFDFLAPRRRILAGGVTTAYLAPGRNRLIPGQGSVVKTFGDDVIERVLADSNCLRVTLDERSTNAPRVFEPTLAPTSDDPLLPARTQYPSARISQLWRLRQVFAEANRLGEADFAGPGMREDRYDPEPLRAVLRKELPLRVAARRAADIRRALGLAREMQSPLVLEDPWQLAPVARSVAESGAMLVLRMPIRLSASNPGGEDLSKLDDPRRSFEAAAVAERAGIPFALAPASDRELADLLLVAGFSIREGVSAERAVRAITSDAARALGVADRVGSLAKGKDADFLILSGEPFSVGTLVEQTYVDGIRAFERDVRSDVLVVRADTVMTGDGNAIAGGGAVIAKAGKVNAVGAALAVPFGATEIVAPPGSVITPGFINANTSAGLSGIGTGVPGAAANQRIADVVRPNDPVLAEVAKSGTTTVLVSGAGGRGRITAVKTAGDSRDDLVLEDIAGVRLAFDALGDGAIKALASQLDKGKKYADKWVAYEKKLAEWKAEQAKPKDEGKKVPVKKAPEPEKAPEPVEEEGDPVNGTWEFEGEASGPQPGLVLPFQLVLNLTREETEVTGDGEFTLTFGPNEIQQEIEVEGTFEDGTLKLEVSGGPGRAAELEVTLEGNEATGSFQFGPFNGDVSGERTEEGDASPKRRRRKKNDDGRPEPPPVDENLEPLRAVVEKRAVAVVETRLAGAIEEVVKLFAERELSLVLTGIDDALDTPEILGDNPPPVLVGPRLVREFEGEMINEPALLADRSVKLAIGTADTLGARFLPLQAAHAIRYGLDPDAALRALTSDAAKAFGIDDRVGSLSRGMDADFVLWTGNPFEPGSRVLLVVVGGRIVVDNRAGGRTIGGDDD